MPSLGLGCWLAPEDALAEAVAYAIEVGYRHIDGATVYRNEKAMGEGIKMSKAKREDLWITTKLWNSASQPTIASMTESAHTFQSITSRKM